MATFDPEAAAAGKAHGVPLLLDSNQINRSDLIGSVRQLVGSVTSKLNISPTATNGIEEAMAKLEATDESFNRYCNKVGHSEVRINLSTKIRLQRVVPFC